MVQKGGSSDPHDSTLYNIIIVLYVKNNTLCAIKAGYLIIIIFTYMYKLPHIATCYETTYSYVRSYMYILYQEFIIQLYNVTKTPHVCYKTITLYV